MTFYFGAFSNNKKIKTKFISLLFPVSIFLLLINTCFAETQTDDSKWLITENILKQAKLEMVWSNKMPLKENETLKEMRILGDCVFALSNQNYMMCMNKNTGKFGYGRKIAPEGFIVMGLELFKDEVLSIIGDKLVEINPETGNEISSVTLGFSVVCPPARNNDYYYFGATDGRVHVLQAEGKIPLFKVTSDNDSAITSVLADDDFVIFSTEAGNVISITPNRPKLLWQFDATDYIVPPMIRDDGSLYIASKDTNLYKIDITNGKLIWRYQTQALLTDAPQVAGKTVYQYVKHRGIVALDKDSGKFKWNLPDALSLLSESKDRAYIFAKPGLLIVMDNKTNEQLYSVNFAPVSHYLPNTTDSRIYIANKTGRIVCLKPAK